MTRQDLGLTPDEPASVVTLGFLRAIYPSYSTFLSVGANYTVVLPPDPVNYQMELFEVYATADVSVTFPNDVLLTGLGQNSYEILTGLTGFFGFRYSMAAGTWFLLSATVQI